ncbi:hypothetical protein [Mycobacterium sp. OAE908]|uniref:hypothetical protein n=1 Tax=Mycobacterium sp. OAE908 TaxID=2817899 RepID=UPI001AE132BD
MPAEPIKVNPSQMLQGGASVAATAERAISNPGAAPIPKPGSPMDTAAASVAAAMGTQVTQMTAQVASKGPALQATTSSGVAQTEATDEQNAERYRAVPGTGGLDGLGSGRTTGGIMEVSDGWDDPREPFRITGDMEEDEFGHFHAPYVPLDPGGAAGGGSGAGRAPV